MRDSLRASEVTKLTREFQKARGEGHGPDEAWAIAKKSIGGVLPTACDAWREQVEDDAANGTAPAPVTGDDVFTRCTKLDAENAQLKSRLAEQATVIENMRKGGYDELLKQRDDARTEIQQLGAKLAAAESDRYEKSVKLDEAKVEIARLVKENEALILGETQPDKGSKKGK